ncbi:Na(+)/citrate cotransporter-like isoform X2 [Cebidichthys violaceus]|uniref:Na(+)/citrate cotransporter-like isoform X2 n=1 Tax=Cebidichthys violaceus TaxID=271503 RepID=UPI0035CC8A4C
MSVLPLRVKMLQQVWRLRGVLVLACSPIILLPLAISTTEAACAYVIIVMAVYWCTEVLPLAVTALLPTILFPVLGIMESKDVCMQYLKDTNMLFVGGLMVAVAVEHWNLHKRIALRVLLLVGVRPALLMLGFMGVTAFLSMWISNTATTAMMVPIVQAVLEQFHGNVDPEPSSKTQRGSVDLHQEETEKTNSVQQTTTANILDNGVNGETFTQGNSEKSSNTSSEAQMDRQEIVKLTPQDKPPLDSTNSGPVVAVVSVENVCCQMELEELSDEEEKNKKLSKGLLLCVCYSASIGGIATLTGTGPNLVLMGQMSQLFPRNGDVINFASWFAFAFPTMVLTLTLAWFWLQFLYIGCNLRRTWGCGAAQSEKERAAYEVIQDEHRRLGPVTYGEVSVLVLLILMVVLWFTRDPRFMDGWATHVFNAKAEFVTDATVALFVAVLLFVFPSEPPRYLCFWRSDTGNKHTGNRHTGNRQTGNRHTGNRQTGNRHTGNRQTGNRHTGNRHTGNRHTSNRHTNNRHTGNKHTGNKHTGNRHTSNRQTGNRHTGTRQTGNKHTGNRHTGNRHTGNRQTGNRHTGNRQTDNKHTGNRQTDNKHTGNRHTGNKHTGNRHTGNKHTGNRHTGNRHTGNRHTGNRHTGNRQTGNRHTGNRQTGNKHTGNRHTGNKHTGNRHTGNKHTGNRHTGNICKGNTHTQVTHLIFYPIRVPGVTRLRPCAAHLAGDSEEDALEHRPAAGRRLCSGQRQ